MKRSITILTIILVIFSLPFIVSADPDPTAVAVPAAGGSSTEGLTADGKSYTTTYLDNIVNAPTFDTKTAVTLDLSKVPANYRTQINEKFQSASTTEDLNAGLSMNGWSPTETRSMVGGWSRNNLNSENANIGDVISVLGENNYEFKEGDTNDQALITQMKPVLQDPTKTNTETLQSALALNMPASDKQDVIGVWINTDGVETADITAIYNTAKEQNLVSSLTPEMQDQFRQAYSGLSLEDDASKAALSELICGKSDGTSVAPADTAGEYQIDCTAAVTGAGNVVFTRSTEGDDTTESLDLGGFVIDIGQEGLQGTTITPAEAPADGGYTISGLSQDASFEMNIPCAGCEDSTKEITVTSTAADGSITFAQHGEGDEANANIESSIGMQVEDGFYTFLNTHGPDNEANKNAFINYLPDGEPSSVFGTIIIGSEGGEEKVRVTGADDWLWFNYPADALNDNQDHIIITGTTKSMDINMENGLEVLQSESNANANVALHLSETGNSITYVEMESTEDASQKGTATIRQIDGQVTIADAISSNTILMIQGSEEGAGGTTRLGGAGIPRTYVYEDGTMDLMEFDSESQFAVTQNTVVKNAEGKTGFRDSKTLEMTGAGSYDVSLGELTQTTDGPVMSTINIQQQSSADGSPETRVLEPSSSTVSTWVISGLYYGNQDEIDIEFDNQGMASVNHEKANSDEMLRQPDGGYTTDIVVQGSEDVEQTIHWNQNEYEGRDFTEVNSLIDIGVAPTAPSAEDAASITAVVNGAPVVPADEKEVSIVADSGTSLTKREAKALASDLSDNLKEGILPTDITSAGSQEQQAIGSQLATIQSQIDDAQENANTIRQDNSWWSRTFGSSTDDYTAAKEEINELEIQRDILSDLYVGVATRDENPQVADTYIRRAQNELEDQTAYTNGDGFYGDISASSRDYFGLDTSSVSMLDAFVSSVDTSTRSNYETYADGLYTQATSIDLSSSTTSTSDLRAARTQLKYALNGYERAGLEGTSKYNTAKAAYDQTMLRLNSVSPPLL